MSEKNVRQRGMFFFGGIPLTFFDNMLFVEVKHAAVTDSIKLSQLMLLVGSPVK